MPFTFKQRQTTTKPQTKENCVENGKNEHCFQKPYFKGLVCLLSPFKLRSHANLALTGIQITMVVTERSCLPGKRLLIESF